MSADRHTSPSRIVPSPTRSPSPLGGAGGLAAFLSQWVRTAAVALVVALPLAVTPWGQDAYSRPKVLILYSLMISMLGAWIVLGTTSQRRRWIVTAPELALWAFVLATLVSSWTTVNARLTIFGGPGRYEGLLTIGACLALYFVGVHFFGTRTGLRRLVTWTAAAGSVVVVYGILQLYVPPLFAGEAFMREWYGGLGIPRISSTVGGPIVVGGYLAFMLPLLLALAIGSSSSMRYVWLAVACLSILTVALTLTRAAWLAAVIGLSISAAAMGPPMWRRHRMITAAMAAAAALSATILVTVVATPGQIGARVATSVVTESGSLAQRLYIWEHTLGLIRDRPLLGWGLETLREVFPYDRDSLVRHFGLRPVIIDRAHNDILQTAVSIGVPGTLAYVTVWVLIITSAARLLRRGGEEPRLLIAGWLGAVAAYVVQAQFSFSTVAITPLVWLLAGAACGWEATGAQSAPALPATGRAWRSTAATRPG